MLQNSINKISTGASECESVVRVESWLRKRLNKIRFADENFHAWSYEF